MSGNNWISTLVASQADGTALANSTTATSILNAADVFTLPNNFFLPRKKLRLRASGRISNIVTTPGTLTLDVRLGSIVVFNGGAMALNIVAKTNVTWDLVIEMICRAVGSGTSANLLGTGKWGSESVIGSPLPSVGGAGSLLLPASAPAVGNGFDSTAAQALNLFATWSVANAGNSIQLHNFSLEDMN